MRFSRSDLLQLKDFHLVFDEDIAFTEEISKQFKRIRRINTVNVKGDGYYHPDELRLYINLKIKGCVIVGCDVTNEDVEVPIETSEDVIYTFDKKEEDIDIVKAENEHIQLLPTIFQLILMEIPTKVVKKGQIDYPKGDGWEVMSESEYRNRKQQTIDPRLAILQDFKPQDEEEV